MPSAAFKFTSLRPASRSPEYIPLRSGEGAPLETSKGMDPFACFGFADFVRILARMDELRSAFTAPGVSPGASVSSLQVEDGSMHQPEAQHAGRGEE